VRSAKESKVNLDRYDIGLSLRKTSKMLVGYLKLYCKSGGVKRANELKSNAKVD